MTTLLEAVVDKPQTDLLEAETKRQQGFLEGALSFIRRDPFLTSDEKERRLLKIKELTDWTTSVKSGEKTMDQFWEFQTEKIELPDYLFLAQTVEGLIVNWWRMALAQIDALKYGPGIKNSDQVRATISKRSAKL